MTVLRKPSYKIAGQEVKVASNYSVRDNEFYINVPAPVCETMGVNTVSSKDSLDAVERGFRALLVSYEEKAKTRREVIFYTFKSKVRPLQFIGEENNFGYRSRGISFNPDYEVPTYGIGLDLWFLCGFTETNPNTGKRTYFDQSMNRIGDDDTTHGEWKIMDYSEARLDFFVAFRNYLKAGIENMQRFFSPSQNIPALIDQAMMTKALPFPTNEPEKKDA